GEIYNCLTGAKKGETAEFHKAASHALTDASDASARAMRDFRTAMLAAQKTVSIEIDLDDLKSLKVSNYKLCFAKKVGTEAYNVVWQSYVNYLAFNDFSWTPAYQLFGSNTFTDNVTVKVSTNKVDIGLGEQSTLDVSGILSPASTGGKPTAITMLNDYG